MAAAKKKVTSKNTKSIKAPSKKKPVKKKVLNWDEVWSTL